MRHKLFLVLALLGGVLVNSVFADESLTITTYYPSPYGSYRELSAQRMKIGAAYLGSSTTVADNNLIVEGSVGIGTPAPAWKLQIEESAGNSGIGFSRGGVGYGAILINTVNQMQIQSTNGSPIRFSADGFVNEHLRITPAGNVGIGEVAPGSKLSVSGGATIGAGYDTTAAPINGLLIEGSVGIGTPTPNATLDVNGGVKIGNQVICNVAARGTVRYNALNGMQYCNGVVWTNVGGEIDYSDCIDKSLNRVGGSQAWTYCDNDYVMVGVEIGKWGCDTGCSRLPGTMRCCRLK